MFKPTSVEIVARRLRTCSHSKNFTLDTMNEQDAVREIKVRSKLPEGMFGVSHMSSGNRPVKPSYQSFLSDHLYDTVSFNYIQKGCPQEEIEKIRTQFEDFTFLLFCGRGQFGSVWLVEDFWGQIVALKLIDKKSVRQLETEKRGLAAYRERISNFEHLIEIYEIGETEDFFYYTMEAAYSVSNEYYVPITLARLQEHFFFYSSDCADISLDILNGLNELHSNDLAHRDIKPENIILVDNKIKIGDISLISHKNRKSYAGTELFIPQDMNDIPFEQFGVNCDLFAAGKVLYSLLANEEDIARFPQIKKDILQDPLAKKLNQLINKACDPSYKNRFASAYEFIQALKKLDVQE